jgi:hypothetical protein
MKRRRSGIGGVGSCGVFIKSCISAMSRSCATAKGPNWISNPITRFAAASIAPRTGAAPSGLPGRPSSTASQVDLAGHDAVPVRLAPAFQPAPGGATFDIYGLNLASHLLLRPKMDDQEWTKDRRSCAGLSPFCGRYQVYEY